ncbi:hypothetical protein V1477_016353 [Vespula maculifrons]|uniref:Uncharacterized protein n=2 Tax=Vespula TaxID=7451 RepID=A0A834K4B2_VESVU|nr:hypothetical protein HZH66_006833 [Vespula vulgaris]
MTLDAHGRHCSTVFNRNGKYKTEQMAEREMANMTSSFHRLDENEEPFLKSTITVRGEGFAVGLIKIGVIVGNNTMSLYGSSDNAEKVAHEALFNLSSRYSPGEFTFRETQIVAPVGPR